MDHTDPCLLSAMPIWAERKRIFDAPSIFQSTVKAFYSKTKFGCPIFDTLGFSIKFNHLNLRCISSLIPSCCPATVRGFVVSVIVFPFDAVANWFGSHVIEKIIKPIVFHPSFANGDATSSVIFVFSRIRIIATQLHCPPRMVFSRWILSSINSTVSMLKRAGLSRLKGQASARFRVTGNHPISLDFGCLSAITQTHPPRSWASFGSFYNVKSSEFLSNKIKCFWHSDIFEFLSLVFNIKITAMET